MPPSTSRPLGGARSSTREPIPGGANNPPAASCPLGVDAHLDSDGDVDLSDFTIFAQNFTGAM
jgi:hypothetical protein